MSQEERDQLLDHEYDGIREYDNRLPNWWLWTLYGTIFFAILYWLLFHTFGLMPLPKERYRLSMAKAAEEQLARMGNQEISDESLALMSSIPARTQAGRQIFEQFCVVCHADRGEGSVGPNLTDAYWIHGGKPTEILNTVTHGVPDKGMVAWGNQLGPARVQDVLAYLLTIKGTDVPGKAPEGTMEGSTPPDAPADPATGESSPGDQPAATTPSGEETSTPASSSPSHEGSAGREDRT